MSVPDVIISPIPEAKRPSSLDILIIQSLGCQSLIFHRFHVDL